LPDENASAQWIGCGYVLNNLNKISFSKYGVVLADKLANRGFPSGDGWVEEWKTINSTDSMYLLAADNDLYLDFEQGMTILQVAADENVDSVEYFYLDKPVCIHAGIYFAVEPYNESSLIRMVNKMGTSIKSVSSIDPSRRYMILPKLEIKNIYTVFYQEKEKGFFFKGEEHRAFELTYVDKGCMHSVVNGRDFLLEQGDMMLYGSDQWHMQYADPECSPCFITVSFDMVSAYADALLNCKFRVDPYAADMLRHLIHETEISDIFSEDMLISSLKQFLLIMLRYVYNGSDEQKLRTPAMISNENEIVEKALRFITENVNCKITVSLVSKHVNVSTTYLATLFKKCLSTSPSKHINRIKLEESKILIKKGELNFTEISDKLHFATVHHFSRNFKMEFGISPTEYSRAMR